ncbi:MAG TPA: M48 family metalloprotease [Nitrospirota bacterium]
MPLTFIDIERQKNWRIGIFFLVLLLVYFAITVLFAASLLHATFFAAPRFWVFAGATALLVAGIHFWFSAYDTVSTVVRELDARPPDPRDDIHAMLLNIMDEMHVATGNKRRIGCAVIPSLSMNALAAADLRGEAVIGITEGLLSRLTREQIETVIAHEAHHILSGDCLETTVASSIFGTYAAAMEKLSADSPRGRAFFSPALGLAWLLLRLSYLLNMFISREREYRADAAAVRMTRNPVALAETLHLLARSWRGAGFIGSGYEMLCIVNPEATVLDETEGFWADLLSTHPPVQKRIDMLLAMAHVSIAELEEKAKRAESAAQKPAGPRFYAMNPRKQWQGPFAQTELAALPWLSPLTWVTTGKEQPVHRAGKDPFISAIFAARLSREEGAASDLACPSCSQPLVMESYEGTQVYQCRFCAGSLVESGKIPRILARTDRERPCTERLSALTRTMLKENQLRFGRQKLSAKDRDLIPLRHCPKCKNPMLRGFYSAAYLIELDRCSFCGLTWFDRDELAMLQCIVESKAPGTPVIQ